MDLKDVLKKIMSSEELKFKLESARSFDEVYGFFVANGYEGSMQKLKEELSRGSTVHKALTDEELLNVAGGVSGRQVLSACAGLMMLMGLAPSANFGGYTASAATVSQSDVEGKSDKEMSYAILNRDLDKVKRLVESGVDVNLGLRQALRHSRADIVKYLVESGAKVGEEELRMAFYTCGKDVVMCMIEHGAKVGNKPYEFLYFSGQQEDYIKYMVAHGAKIGSGTLWYAATAGDLGTVKYLVEEHEMKITEPVLRRGAVSGNVSLVEYLIGRGAKFNIKKGLLLEVVKDASTLTDKYLDMLKYLVKQGAEIDGSELLYVVKRGGSLDMIKYLVEQGANINAKDYEGHTMLGWAIKQLKFEEYYAKRSNKGLPTSEYYKHLKSVVEYLRSQGAKE